MAVRRHERGTVARRRPLAVLLAVPTAVLATLIAVGISTAPSAPQPAGAVAARSAGGSLERPALVSRTANRRAAAVRAQDDRQLDRMREQRRRAAERRQRAAERRAADEAARRATERAVQAADTRLWTTATLNLWTAPGGDARNVGLLDEGEQVLVTGRSDRAREEIVLGGNARWVTAGYLSNEEPVAGLGGACTNGSSVASGVSPNIVAVHAAVCAAFPEITTYGTFRADGEHAQGIAVDIMVSGDRGWQVAELVRANAAELGVNYLIYSRNIWSVQRGGEGWRPMGDRGSTTANHYDHVHVTTY